MMPFSAVVTGLISVASGLDDISHSLVFGALIVLSAAIISGFGDAKEKNRKA